MSEAELGRILKSMYENAAKNDALTQIHLFGIKYANEINHNNYKATDITKASGIKSSFATEVSKGMRLAKYVELKKI